MVMATWSFFLVETSQPFVSVAWSGAAPATVVLDDSGATPGMVEVESPWVVAAVLAVAVASDVAVAVDSDVANAVLVVVVFVVVVSVSFSITAAGGGAAEISPFPIRYAGPELSQLPAARPAEISPPSIGAVES